MLKDVGEYISNMKGEIHETNKYNISNRVKTGG